MHFSYNFSFNFFNIIILVYLIIDAPKHRKNPILWGILGFLFGTFALIIYLYKTGRNFWGLFWLIITILLLLMYAGLVYAFFHVFI